ncbi:4503_t:CDS:2 [Funneliformis mosseae]|uniref:4503_t:CDS:1 n=1 Tax=Funneliformis mosseae TaxID=27381 RepID=A0A9N9CD07_FUNMO|nr:4503_t:CDS:2 [Funneliformis mosseae]
MGMTACTLTMTGLRMAKFFCALSYCHSKNILHHALHSVEGIPSTIIVQFSKKSTIEFKGTKTPMVVQMKRFEFTDDYYINQDAYETASQSIPFQYETDLRYHQIGNNI